MHADDASYMRLPDNRDEASQYLFLYELSLGYGMDLTDQIVTTQKEIAQEKDAQLRPAKHAGRQQWKALVWFLGRTFSLQWTVLFQRHKRWPVEMK